MNHKEIAIELVEKFMTTTLGNDLKYSKIDFFQAKIMATISIDLLLKEFSKMKLIFSDRELIYKDWNGIKQEIEKL